MSVIMLSHRDKDQPSPGEPIASDGERHHGNGERAAASELDEYRNKLVVANAHLATAKIRDRKERPGGLRKGHGKRMEKVGFEGQLGEQPGVCSGRNNHQRS